METIFIPCDAAELVRQIGRRNLLAISGGRVMRRETGVTLPVDCGYSVTVDLAAGDTYVVRRIFRRGRREWTRGERTNVYCDEVGEAAYYASCFRSYDGSDWPTRTDAHRNGAVHAAAETWEDGPDAYRQAAGGWPR
jgi:hypothetical protein